MSRRLPKTIPRARCDAPARRSTLKLLLAFGSVTLFGQGAVTRAEARSSPAANQAANTPAIPDVITVQPQSDTALALGAPDAPSAGPDPGSLLGRQAIEQYVAPTGNYDDAVRLTPSTVDVSPNGPGLGAAQGLTIRGFADGQYDVTFDGIPFGDSDDFTHHSDAYVLSRDLASVSIDRGPGNATTVGDATFGGTVALRSIDPDATGGLAPDLVTSTDATLGGGVLANSGAVGSGGSIHALLDLEGERSDGALDDVAQRRGNVFAKMVVSLGPRTELTVVSSVARTIENDPPGAIKAEIEAFGPSFALNDDPRSQAFNGSNESSYHTDLEYALLSGSTESGVSWSDQLYTYALERHFSTGLDPDGETPNGTALAPDGVPGLSSRNGLRAWGDIVRGTVPLAASLSLETGVWIEQQRNGRDQIDVDLAAGNAPNPILAPVAGVPGSAAIARAQEDTLFTLQPYVQLRWRPVPSVLLSAGLRGAVFTRSVDAPVMEGTRLPTDAARTVGAPIPSLSVEWRIAPQWRAYATAARGFLAPPLQFFDVSDPATAAIKPETTWNFQAGLAWNTPGRTIALDLYQILFENAVESETIGEQTIDEDAGDAIYRGVEAEATQALGAGWALTGSASANGGRQHGTDGSNGGPDPGTPQGTLGGGLVWSRNGWIASAIDRWVGGQWGDRGGTQWIDPFNQLDLALGKRWRPKGGPPLRLQAQLFNVADSRRIDGFAGYTVADATPLYWTQAGRSLFVSATARF